MRKRVGSVMDNRRTAILGLELFKVVLYLILGITVLSILVLVSGVRVKIGFSELRSRPIISATSNSRILAGDYFFKEMRAGRNVVAVSGIISFGENGNYFFSVKEKIDDQLFPASSGSGTYIITGNDLILKPTVSRFLADQTVLPDTFKFKFSFDGRNKLNIKSFTIKDFAVVQKIEYVLVRKTKDGSGEKSNEKEQEGIEDRMPEIPNEQKDQDKKEI